jgi:hypothetical protein
MKRKIFSILFALVLVLSFSLMTAVPVMAEPGEVLLYPVSTEGRPDLVGTITADGGSVYFNIRAVGQADDGDDINTSKWYSQTYFDNEYFTISANGKFLKYNMFSDPTPYWGTSWGDATNPLPEGVTFSVIEEGDDFVYAISMSYAVLEVSDGDTFPVQIKARDFNDDYVESYDGYDGYDGEYSHYNGLYITDTGVFNTYPTPTQVWVDDDWVTLGLGEPANGHTFSYDAFSTIQEGIDAVASSGTVSVAAGNYTITSAITVDKGLTITGNTSNPENVVVTYAAPSQTLDCFDMQANNVTVQGISAVNSRYGFNFATSDPTGCTISDCVIDHCYEGAINIDGGSGHTISDNTITHCLTSGTKSGVIYIYGCPDTTIDGNTLIDNGLTGAHATMGIYVKYTYPSSPSERVEVINNNISGMLGINADIQIYDAPYTYIYNNTISNSEDKGIAIFGIAGNPAYTSTANRVQVIGNTISLCKWPGMQAANSPYTYVYDNTLTQCNYWGADDTGDFDYSSIHIDAGSANCIIDNNTVSDGINGIQTWSNDTNITNNEIYDMGKTYADTKVVGGRTYKNSGILIGSNFGNPATDHDPTGTTIQFM